MAPKTTRYDTAVLLKTKKDVTAYLNAVFEEDDPALIAHALGVGPGSRRIAKRENCLGAPGMTAVFRFHRAWYGCLAYNSC
jgi:hypothetical protein